MVDNALCKSNLTQSPACKANENVNGSCMGIPRFLHTEAFKMFYGMAGLLEAQSEN